VTMGWNRLWGFRAVARVFMGMLDTV